MKHKLLAALLFISATTPAFAASVFTTRLDDPRAVYLSDAKGDGKADDSAALQAAIDKADKNGEGILFIPSGRYRLTRTLYVWPGVRVIGTGASRPVFVLADNTPGFQNGVADMVMFAGFHPGPTSRPGFRIPFPPPGSVPANDRIGDANPGTFYSALSNIDFEIGKGDAAAVAIRFHVAQHAYLGHIDFHLGSGLAGINQVGNEAEDLRFFGGRYGILAEKTSPAWQFTLIDSVFEGQREAGIREHEAGLTLIHDTFRHEPVAISIDPEDFDELWVKDSRFEDITDAALILSDENNPLGETGVENAVLNNTPVFVRFRESGKTLGGKGAYEVASFSHGLIVPDEGAMGVLGTRYHSVPLSHLPGPLPPAIRPLPPATSWVNLRSLGAKGDGMSDDTAAIQKAIDTSRVLYVPSGRYLVHDTIRLKPDTVLVGLHPSLSQFDLADNTPGYEGIGAPRPLLEAPEGGHNIVAGIGLFTGGINPRAVAALWMAGADSLMDDVRFLGGHGTNLADGTRFDPYNDTHSADPDTHKRWDGQYPSLWVRHGGGTFANIWTPDTYAQAGLYVSDTTTPGHVYELSSEHHVRNELKLERVENWDIAAPQTEEEAGESQETVSLEITQSKNITIANYHAYRVTRSVRPAAAAVRLFDSSAIHFRNVHVNAESGLGTCDANGCGTYLRASKFPYENTIQDLTRHLEVREREFASLDIGGTSRVLPPEANQPSALPAPGTRVQRLEGDFYSISGAAVDAAGVLYFVDHHQQRIYRWSETGGLSIERDNPLDPVNLAFDKAGDLIVLSSLGTEGTAYSFRPGSPEAEITLLPPQAAAPHPGAAALLPGNYWNNGEFKDQLDTKSWRFTTLGEMFARDLGTPRPKQYVSPDGSLFLPQARVFQQGQPDYTGWRFSDDLDTNGFVSAMPGQRIYLSDDSRDRTYSGLAGADGAVTDLKPFAERGGESVAVDTKGNVFIANGQVFVYDKAGKQIGQIDVPERPIDILFGGSDHRTLFILSHHSLYAVKTAG